MSTAILIGIGILFLLAARKNVEAPCCPSCEAGEVCEADQTPSAFVPAPQSETLPATASQTTLPATANPKLTATKL